jgi:AmiR/NasT family two-component response regulator
VSRSQGQICTHAWDSCGLAVSLPPRDRRNTRHQFESALASRDLIGQAKGILMNEFSVDAVRAFEMIVKQSQNNNVRVAVIAQQIIDAYSSDSHHKK